MSILISIFVMIFISGAWCWVPEEVTLPRQRRTAVVPAEAMFQRINEALSHPYYSTIAKRPGEPTRTHSCGSVRSVPAELRRRNVMRPNGLSQFYQKYTEAYGIPVIGSYRVSDNALQRACYTLRFLLADNAKVRRAYYKMSGRVALIGRNEQTTNIPEHSHLPKWWDTRARGLGATWSAPVSTAGEENAACINGDRYFDDDIVLHEYLHGLHNLGLNYAVPQFEERMKALYEQTKRRGLWRNTYSMSTDREYFAEAGQSYIGSHTESIPPNNIHNHVNTRAELRSYDSAIYNVMRHVFTCNNYYLPRCDPRKTQQQQRRDELNQVLRMDCPLGSVNTGTTSTGSTSTGTTSTGSTSTGTSTSTGRSSASRGRIEVTAPCRDYSYYCRYWASRGECHRNPRYMQVKCRRSCHRC